MCVVSSFYLISKLILVLFIKYNKRSKSSPFHQPRIREKASIAPLEAKLLSESPPLEFTRAGELNFSRVGFAWPIEHWAALSLKGAHIFLLLAAIRHTMTI